MSQLVLNRVDIGKLDNINSFKPERWANPTKEMKDASLPFGGGSRSKSLDVVPRSSHQ